MIPDDYIKCEICQKRLYQYALDNDLYSYFDEKDFDCYHNKSNHLNLNFLIREFFELLINQNAPDNEKDTYYRMSAYLLRNITTAKDELYNHKSRLDEISNFQRKIEEQHRENIAHIKEVENKLFDKFEERIKNLEKKEY